MAVVSMPSTFVLGRPLAIASRRVSVARRTPAVSCKPSDDTTAPAEAPIATEEAAAPASPLPTPQQSIFKGGVAQERLNGRTAMIGFTAAVVGELLSQETVVQQLFQRYIPEGGFREQVQPEIGLLLLPFTVILILFASFAPRINGAKPDGLTDTPKPWGPFTPEAEQLNGRAAMLGFIALLAVEAGKGSALF